MKKQTLEALVVGLATVACLVLFIYFSITVRQAHDAEVRQQVIETCKEFK